MCQVSLETSGLDTLFGTEATQEAEEEELMAGMSAMFLGVQIQPIVFFQGYSDLMSKYFSAGEGPMDIISGNILVLDYRQVKGFRCMNFYSYTLLIDSLMAFYSIIHSAFSDFTLQCCNYITFHGYEI